MRILNFRLASDQQSHEIKRFSSDEKHVNKWRKVKEIALAPVFNCNHAFGIHYLCSTNTDMSSIDTWGCIVPLIVDVYEFESSACDTEGVRFVIDSTSLPKIGRAHV